MMKVLGIDKNFELVVKKFKKNDGVYFVFEVKVDKDIIFEGFNKDLIV